MASWHRLRPATWSRSHQTCAGRLASFGGDSTAEGARNYLRVLADPCEPEVDIIAVHGLNPSNKFDHAEATWTVGHNMWLRDFLPDRLPRARICLYGYNANVAFGSAASGVREHAERLLSQVDQIREHSVGRPLIFICHSLGGLLVKRALIHAKSDGTYDDIWRSTYGIVFFGTPHQGGNGAHIGDAIAAIARLIMGRPTNTFMKALKKGSSFLNSITDDFRQLLEEYHFVSFYETQPLGRYGLVVDRESAVLGLPGNREKQIPIDSNHRSMTKFGSKEDRNYQFVEGQIAALVASASSRNPGECRTKDRPTPAPNNSRVSGNRNTTVQAGCGNSSRIRGQANRTNQAGSANRSNVVGGGNVTTQVTAEMDDALRLVEMLFIEKGKRAS